MTDQDDHLTRARTELGEPEALFQVSRGRFLAKLGLAVLLLLYGIVANYLWWVHGPATFGHFELLLLVVVPLSGFALLWHMYRNRGLFVLIYPSGLLRLRRGEVDSFPWAEIERIRVKVQRTEGAEFARDAAGNLVACWLPAEVPTFQLWNANLAVARLDGIEAHFGPALTDYQQLAEEVQRRTFGSLWAVAWGDFRAGQPVHFDDVEVTPEGLRSGKKFIPWKELKELSVAQGKLTVKQVGKWLPWLLKDVSTVPNPHILFALVAEARSRRAAAAMGEPHAEGDHEEDE